MKNTIIISAFPACGKSYMYNNYNGKPYSMLDSDSSKFSWIYENGVKTDKRNPNFITDYMNHIKDNIRKVDVIFVSSHAEVRKALRENNLKYFMVYPSLDMKEEMLNRMRERGNDSKFIEFQKSHYEPFVAEIISECDKYSGVRFDKNGEMISGYCLKMPLSKNNPYIDNHMINLLFDNSMGNLSCMWWNFKR